MEISTHCVQEYFVQKRLIISKNELYGVKANRRIYDLVKSGENCMKNDWIVDS